MTADGFGVAGSGTAGSVEDGRAVLLVVVDDPTPVLAGDRVVTGGFEDDRFVDDGFVTDGSEDGTGTRSPAAPVVDGPAMSGTVSAASATAGIASSTVVFVQSFHGWNQERPNASATARTAATAEVPARWRRRNGTSLIGPG